MDATELTIANWAMQFLAYLVIERKVRDPLVLEASELLALAVHKYEAENK